MGSWKGVKDGVSLVLNADLQALADMRCNTGSDQTRLKSWFPGLEPQIQGLDPNWYKKQGPWSPDDPAQLAERQRRILDLIKGTLQRLEGTKRPDVVVVAHEGIIGKITPPGPVIQWGEWATFTMVAQTGGGSILREFP
jgi:hypothetical protein